MLITAFDHIRSDLDDLKSMLDRALPNGEFYGSTDFTPCVDYSIENKPDIVFFENIEGNGWYLLADTINKLREIEPNMKFIILHWSNISKAELIWTINSKGVTFLQKPINYDELVETIGEMVAN